MANVTRESIGNLHDKISVSITKEDYLPTFEKALKQQAKTVNVPGFRKGHVPAGMVKKMIGQNLFADEVFRAAGRQLEDYIKEHKLRIFGQPLVMSTEAKPLNIDMNAPSDVELDFEIGLQPEFEIPALSGNHSLTSYKIDITDKLLDDEVERLTRRYGTMEDVDTIDHQEHMVYATLQETDHTGTPLSGAKQEDVTDLLARFPAKLQEMLMGKKADDTMLIKPVDIATEEELPRFMKDMAKAEIAEADKEFEFRIVKAARLIPQESGMELYSQVFPNDMITDEAGFRDKLREELDKEYSRIAGQRLQNDIFETLIHETPIALPVAFLKNLMKNGDSKQRVSEEQVEAEYPRYGPPTTLEPD